MNINTFQIVVKRESDGTISATQPRYKVKVDIDGATGTHILISVYKDDDSHLLSERITTFKNLIDCIIIKGNHSLIELSPENVSLFNTLDGSSGNDITLTSMTNGLKDKLGLPL